MAAFAAATAAALRRCCEVGVPTFWEKVGTGAFLGAVGVLSSWLPVSAFWVEELICWREFETDVLALAIAALADGA